MAQLHKRFTDQQVKDLMQRYLKNELKRAYIQEILRIGKRQFFKLLKEYRENPDKFSIQYQRATATRTIPQEIEQNIIKELTVAKEFIDNKAMPIWSYNYSFIKGAYCYSQG